MSVKAVGADRWKGQWAVVVLQGVQFERAFIARDVSQVLSEVPDAVAIGIDIPIGLPEPGEPRRCDQLARSFVGARWPSVFLTPPLDLLVAPSLRAANQWARTRKISGVSSQTFGLRKAILEVQPVALEDDRIYEVHPEVSFVRANGGRHLVWSKASWNGCNERRRILESHQIVLPDHLGPAGSAGFADLLDAAIVAWSARRIVLNLAVSLPAPSGRIGAIWG